MLTPQEIDRIGDEIGAVYRALENDLIKAMVSDLVRISHLDNMTQAQLIVFAERYPALFHSLVFKRRREIKHAVALEAEALKRSDAQDVERLATLGAAPMHPQRVAQTIRRAEDMVARSNMEIARGAQATFRRVVQEAVFSSAYGFESMDKAVRRAVQTLGREGVKVAAYTRKDGVRVRQNMDAVITRHIRTQIAQESRAQTFEQMHSCGCDLVEVSSHAGARPSHAIWQGRCFSLRGDKTIEGVHYPDFVTATGYGTREGLGGINCRHSFSPYIHGLPRLYEPDPVHESGYTSDEVYALEQGQRRCEREVRECKRELNAAREYWEQTKSDEARLDYLTKKQEVKDAMARHDAFIERANAGGNGATVLLTRSARLRVGKDERPIKRSRKRKATPPQNGRKIQPHEKGITKKRGQHTGAAVDREYIKSREYKEKFMGITGNRKADEAIHAAAVACLTHRDGTMYEDYHLIDGKTGEPKAIQSQTNEALVTGNSREVRKAIKEAVPHTLISIHNHPSNIPPTGSDLAACFAKKLSAGIVACHNGDVYVYKTGAIEIRKEMLDLCIYKYKKRGYNDVEAGTLALNEYIESHDIKWEKRTAKKDLKQSKKRPK